MLATRLIDDAVERGGRAIVARSPDEQLEQYLSGWAAADLGCRPERGGAGLPLRRSAGRDLRPAWSAELCRAAARAGRVCDSPRPSAQGLLRALPGRRPGRDPASGSGARCPRPGSPAHRRSSLAPPGSSGKRCVTRRTSRPSSCAVRGTTSRREPARPAWRVQQAMSSNAEALTGDAFSSERGTPRREAKGTAAGAPLFRSFVRCRT